MEIHKIETGFLAENCWLLVNAQNEAVIIDPGDNAAAILEMLGAAKLQLILLTHSHSDHRGALAELVARTGAPVALHFSEAEIVEQGATNPPDFGERFEKVPVARKLRGGEILDFGKERIEVIATPGHTVGSVCFLVNGELFSGDTLFRENVGRTDLPGGDEDALNASLVKLLKLKPETHVHPGHDADWTIGEARKFFV